MSKKNTKFASQFANYTYDGERNGFMSHVSASKMKHHCVQTTERSLITIYYYYSILIDRDIKNSQANGKMCKHK